MLNKRSISTVLKLCDIEFSLWYIMETFYCLPLAIVSSFIISLLKATIHVQLSSFIGKPFKPLLGGIVVFLTGRLRAKYFGYCLIKAYTLHPLPECYSKT